MFLRQIYDPALAQYAYLVGCQKTGEALLIDPERDVDRYQSLAAENGLRITAVAETHIHADFVSGARELAKDPAVRLYLSAEGGPDWTYRWTEGRENVFLLWNGESFRIGNIEVRAVHTPGHTPEHLSFLITDRGGGADQPIALATGDFLFVGDVGRPDLLETAAGVAGAMAPAAERLGRSLTCQLKELEDFVQVLPGHGAGSACGKALGAVPTSTMGYERRFNGPFKLAMRDPELFVKDILTGQPDPPLYFARMKKVNRDGIEVTGGVRIPERLDAADAMGMAGEAGVRMLDLRGDRAAFAEAHVPGALHAPFPTSFFLAAAGSYVSEDESLLLIVERAEHVEEAVRQLYRIGLDRVCGYVLLRELKEAGQLVGSMERILFQGWNWAELGFDEVILDVRTRSEFEAGHISGAISIPYTRLRARLIEVPGDKRVFVHCGSGKRAALAASYLEAEGFRPVHVDGVCTECERIAERQGMAR